jgi:PTS system galactitol-specific IIB component
MAKKKVLVACGTGIATSTVVVQKVETLIKENGLNAEVEQIKISEAKGKQGEADVIVTTTMLPTKYSIPTITATGYVTGIGTEELDQKIIDALKD